MDALRAAAELEAAGKEQREALPYFRSALALLEPLEAGEDHRVLAALLRLHVSISRCLLAQKPYEALRHAAKALQLPPPCLIGGRATPDEVASAHVLRARAVCAMEEADEMYYEDEGERSALLNDLLRGLEAVAQVQPASEVKELRRRLTHLGSARGTRPRCNSEIFAQPQRSWPGAGAAAPKGPKVSEPAGSALAAARRRRSTSAPRLNALK
ncbi:unnamed protein product, partial [Cladocopium goreaui]